MTNAEKLALQKHACRIRLGVIESTHSAKSGHPGGSLSIAEVLSFLYFREMRVDPANPAWPGWSFPRAMRPRPFMQPWPSAAFSPRRS